VRVGWWLSLPWCTFRIPPMNTILFSLLPVFASLLFVLTIRSISTFVPADSPIEPVSTASQIRAEAREFLDHEPLSMIFGLDKCDYSSLVLHSTVIGPVPKALLELDGNQFQVSPGDTILGAVVDSVGRGIVFLKHDGEIISVTL